MKKLLFLVWIVLYKHTVFATELSHDKRYWIEEINKTGHLTERMISNHFDVSPESFAENIYGGSKSDMDSWRKTTLVIAEVIKNNNSNLKSVNIDGFNHAEFNSFYTSTFLEAISYSKTIETFRCTRVPVNGAYKVADIVKNNRIIKVIECKDSNFDDEGALAIANALKTNNTLQELNMKGSKFSMSSRDVLREAWAVNKVNNRKQDIEF